MKIITLKFNENRLCNTIFQLFKYENNFKMDFEGGSILLIENFIEKYWYQTC